MELQVRFTSGDEGPCLAFLVCLVLSQSTLCVREKQTQLIQNYLCREKTLSVCYMSRVNHCKENFDCATSFTWNGNA